MKKPFKQLIIIFSIILVMLIPYFVFAGNAVLDKLEKVGVESKVYDTGDADKQLAVVIASVIKAFLSLLGLIFIILIILSGYNWMTAQGDEQKVTKAKDTIRTAIIGLFIIIAAYGITYFVFRGLSGGGSSPLGTSG